jgi:hypothetical protein
VARVADCELGGVHAHGNAARAGGDVVAREPALAPLVEPAFGGQGERVRRDDEARADRLANGLIGHGGC